MTPFQEFRLWSRRAPVGERATVTLAAAAVMAALIWTVAPSSTPSGTVRTAGGGTAGALQAVGSGSGSGSASGTGTAAGSSGAIAGQGSSAGGTSGGGATTGSGTASQPAHTTSATGANCPPSTAPGVSATQIKVAISLTDVVGPAANSTFNIPSPQVQQQDFQEVIDSVNAAGGVDCRKIVPSYYNVDPVDQSGMQQDCLNVVQEGVFANIDEGGYANYPQKDCFGQNKVPFFGGYLMTDKEMSQFYPYLFDYGTIDTVYKNTVFGLKQTGFFNPANGFKKLGFVYDDCESWVINEEINWLHQAGLTDSQIDTYDVGCPSVQTPASTLQEAVLQFDRDGVTHVTDAEFTGDFSSFTNIANSEGFHPKFGIPDDYYIPISIGGSQTPNYQEIDGAVAITANQWGAPSTPGMVQDAMTAKCNAIYAAHGGQPVYSEPSSASYSEGLICNQVWVFVAAVEHAPVLSREALAAGLQSVRSVSFSWPLGPNLFSQGVTVGDEMWRVDTFHSACTCWKVTDPTFHPEF